VIINGKNIYALGSDEKLIITLHENNPKVVVTDGFHYTKPLEIVYHHIHTYYFRIVCSIENQHLAFGLLMMSFCFFLGIATGFLLIKFFAFVPILYFLFLYYINKKDFLQIRAA
jgi:hypothetical protein